MSERIYAELTEDFIRRMRNWARWVDESDDKIGPASVRAGGLEPVIDRYRESREPLMWGEGEDTNRALKALPARYEQVIRQFWLYEGRAMRWHGRHRGIDYHTFEGWVIKGHELLKAELAKQTAYYRARALVAQAASGGA